MMKKLSLLVLLLAFGLSGFGQRRFITSWKQSPAKDSTEFIENYGSIDEWNYQHQVDFPEGNAYLAFFIEAKWMYAMQITQYIADEHMCGYGIGLEEGNGERTLVQLGCSIFTGGNGILTDSIKIHLKINEKEGRIKSVQITGPEQYLIKLFKGYWRVKEDDMLSVQKGSKFSVNRMDDLVTFDWTGKRAVIRITQSPMVKNYRHLLIDKKE